VSRRNDKASYCALGSLVTKIEGGGTPSKEVPDFWDGDIPLLTIKDLPNARLGVTVDRITAKGLESSSSKIVPAGIPVIATRMDVGKVVRCPVPVAINQDLRAIYPDPAKVDVDYIVQALPTLEREFRRYSCGSTVMGIGIDDLKSVKIYLPSLVEQRKIADILRTWDEAIETAEAELKAKQERKRGLTKKLLMPSAEGDGVLSSKKNKASYSPLGALVIKIEGGGTPSKEVPGFWDGDIPLLTIKDLPNARLGLTVDRITTSGLESSSSKIVPAGIPVIATRMDVGKVVRCPVQVAINQDLRAIYPDPDKVDVDYIVQVLPTLEREFLRYSCGSTVMGIGIDDLKSVKIYLPPLAEQRKIAEILQGADSDIETINHRIESLRTQKRGLMQKLLTGEVRVAA